MTLPLPIALAGVARCLEQAWQETATGLPPWPQAKLLLAITAAAPDADDKRINLECGLSLLAGRTLMRTLARDGLLVHRAKTRSQFQLRLTRKGKTLAARCKAQLDLIEHYFYGDLEDDRSIHWRSYCQKLCEEILNRKAGK